MENIQFVVITASVIIGLVWWFSAALQLKFCSQLMSIEFNMHINVFYAFVCISFERYSSVHFSTVFFPAI